MIARNKLVDVDGPSVEILQAPLSRIEPLGFSTTAGQRPRLDLAELVNVKCSWALTKITLHPAHAVDVAGALSCPDMEIGARKLVLEALVGGSLGSSTPRAFSYRASI